MWCLGLTTRAGTVVVSCTTGKYHDIALATGHYHRYCPGGSFDLRHRWDTISIMIYLANVPFLSFDGISGDLLSNVRLRRGLICFTQCQQTYQTKFSMIIVQVTKSIATDAKRSTLDITGNAWRNEIAECNG